VYKASTIQQTESANNNLTTEGERIYVQTLRDEHIHSFYIKHEDEAVGWIQLVTKYSNVGYINQLHVLKDYRNLKYGTTLVQTAQAEAIKLGLQRMVVIPSDQAMHLFRRLGYTPLLYFSVFQPNGGYHE
jgi:ribosomal protein S18 acetylase RimI-like enzyme